MKRSTMVLIVLAVVLVATVLAVSLLYRPKAKNAQSALPNGTPEDIENASRAGIPYVVKLGSEDCEACVLIDPVLVALADKYRGKVTFIRIDVYEYPKIAAENRISVIPTTLFYDAAGNKLGAVQGFMDEAQFEMRMKGYGII
ncbi:MAG TPA: thioredoxin family protein [Bacillota bacterium]|nr:thioredoxin family protein [Bacillota bacterium]HOA14742.1 thioredoxin family protein [Bacillota bacterium]HOG52461.1 thioredoxin family protein [Bacillota bacterium]